MERVNARREVRESTMRLAGRPERVFPLLCPVREYDWIETWNAVLVHSDSGVAEKGCVFTTEDPHGPSSVWTVSRYEPAAWAIEFVVVTPGLLVTTLEVALEPDGDGTVARWRRTFTALSPAGERAISALAGPAYEARMERLERQLDHYLRAGEMLRS
jgi:hypothetical protein